MMLVPTDIPVIVADVEVAPDPVVATVVSELVQVPPIVDVPSVVVLPAQRTEVPVIAAGMEPTVTIFVTKHPPGAV